MDFTALSRHTRENDIGGRGKGGGRGSLYRLSKCEVCAFV